MRAWLGSSGTAARLASDRADLWLPAALAWIVSVGWIPFVLVVVPLPGEGDVVTFGARLVTSGLWPLNAILIGLAAVAVVVTTVVLRAVGEAALARAIAAGTGDSPLGAGGRRRAGRDVAALLGVRLVTATPTLLAVVAAALVFAAVAPDEFQSPDIGGETYMRIAGRMLPALVVLVLAMVLGAVVAAVAGHHVIGPRRESAPAALGEAFRELGRRPARLLGIAFSTVVGGGLYLVACALLLRVLWEPLEVALAERPIAAANLLLLIGFVAIWLGLVLGGGVVHAWASAWWALELRAERGGRPQTSSAEGVRPA